MPTLRLIGNSLLSFVNKVSTGYWNVFDSTNGFTALHAGVARQIPFHKLSQRYFFESDLLFRLGTLRAVVCDVPMPAYYADERSDLRVGTAVGEFAVKHVRNTIKRLFYNYFLRSFSIASLNLLMGTFLVICGSAWGVFVWVRGAQLGVFASSGQVMLASLPIIVGVQLILAFLGYDMASSPRVPLHKRL